MPTDVLVSPGWLRERLATVRVLDVRGRVLTQEPRYHADPDAYRAAHPATGAEKLYELLHSDWLFRMPSLRLAEAHHRHGPTYLYELTWNAPGMGGEIVQKQSYVAQIRMEPDGTKGTFVFVK